MSRSKRVLSILAFLPLLFAAGQEPAQQQQEGPTSKRIEAFIVQLGASVRMDRDLAARELMSIGAPALPALERARNSPDAEIRRRAGEIVDHLRAEIACAATLLDLKWKKIPIRLAVEDLAKKTGLPLKLNVPNARPGRAAYSRWITLEGEDVPLLKVLDQLCRVGSLQIRWPPKQNMPIMLAPGPASNYPASYEGPFAVRLRGLQLTRSVLFGGTPRKTSRLELQFEVVAEPRVTLLSSRPLVLSEAIDEHGRSLNLQSVRSANQFTRPPTWGIRSPLAGRSFNVKSYLPLPERTGQQLQSLSGEVTVDLLTGRDLAVTIEDIGSEVGRRYEIGGAAVLIDSVDATDEQLDIAIHIEQIRTARGERGGAFFYDSFELADQNGEVLTASLVTKPNTRIRGQSATSQVRLKAMLSEDHKGPWQLLVYRTQNHSYTIPFRFEDVPLP